MYFDERTQCYLHRVHYDFDEQRGILIMGRSSCTDMSGAIRLFEAIDPGVRLIETFAENVPDTIYRKHTERFGGWRAYSPRNQAA
ncbi:hypothetical protein LJR030_000524 [Rhizobium sp. LjRoot30]|uniref:hypothetical protein n=1 Tax=Rhizobium sp. LjRoot30 TaxID=3342320 RepID=UPI003ED174B1